MKIIKRKVSSDVIYSKYQRVRLIMKEYDPNSKEYGKLNSFAWTLIEKYINKLFEEF